MNPSIFLFIFTFGYSYIFERTRLLNGGSELPEDLGLGDTSSVVSIGVSLSVTDFQSDDVSAKHYFIP